jgi:hypothetical protein
VDTAEERFYETVSDLGTEPRSDDAPDTGVTHDV